LDELIKELKEKTYHYLIKIEEKIKEELEIYSSSRFYVPLKYALEGGKRVRPLIVLLATDAVGGNFEKSLDAALAIELLHTESIIHDDIIDEEEFRRDKLAFHAKYGYNLSILTADFVLGLILKILSRYEDKRILKEVSSAAIRMCEGELWEMNLKSVTWEEYLEIIKNKTASLFEVSAIIGGIIGEASPKEISSLGGYGLNLGMAYQLKDDLLDIDKKDKIISLLNIENKRDVLEKETLNYSFKAKKELSFLKDSKAKDLLILLADFVVKRDI